MQTEIKNEEGEGGQEASTAQTSHSKEREDKTEQHTETRVEEQSSNLDEGEMEEQAGFEEVTYRQNRRRQ
jgi:hypothetical protein